MKFRAALILSIIVMVGGMTAALAQGSPPVAVAGPDQSIQATGPTTSFTIDGSASYDPDGDVFTGSWYDQYGRRLGYGPKLTLNRPIGVYKFTLAIEDLWHYGSSDTVTVTIYGKTAITWGWPSSVTPQPTGFTQIVSASAGYDHALAALTDGTVVCTGNNSYGKATPPAGLSGVTAVSAGYDYSLALKSNGTVVAWGSNSFGQCDTAALTGVVSISAGRYTAAAVRSNGTVVVWGSSSTGLLRPPTGLSGVVAVAVGTLHCLALKSDGTVVGWGGMPDGAAVPAGLSEVVGIAAGDGNSMAVKSDGTVVGWGITYQQQPAGLSGVAAVSCGSGPFCALKSDGTVVSWGLYGPPACLAAAKSIDVASSSGIVVCDSQFPVAKAGADQMIETTGVTAAFTLDGTASSDPEAETLGYVWKEKASSVVVGTTPTVTLERGPGVYTFTLVVTDTYGQWTKDDVVIRIWSPTVVGWGSNSSGQIPANLKGVTAVSAGGYHSLALRADGTVAAFGENGWGQCNIPAGLSGVTAIAAGHNHSVALRSDGSVVTWGNNQYFQCDAGAAPSVATAIGAGYWHTLAVRPDGTVAAWGNNNYGQCTPPTDLTGVTAVDAGLFHSVALKSDGTVVCWGDNRSGQSTPPADLTGVTAISAGQNFCLALKSDGTVVGWGDNASGAAVPPAGLTGVTAIAAGYYHGLALKSDGSIVAWPSGYAPPPGLVWSKSIAAGYQFSLAITRSRLPVAMAGPDQLIESAVPVGYRIQDSGSYDPDGDAISMIWYDAQGSPKVWGGGWTFDPVGPGIYSYNLRVTDAFGQWGSDDTVVEIRAAAPPVISSVNLYPTQVAAGDMLRLTVYANDNVGVTSVTADGVALTPDGYGAWTGALAASAALGNHPVIVKAFDALNQSATNTTKSYTTKAVVGISPGSVTDSVTTLAQQSFLFKVWGKVTIVDEYTVNLDDGSGGTVNVFSFDWPYLRDGDYASARGSLDTTTTPPTLRSDWDWITKY